ncbi:MAG: corrinoid protein [Clostridia bacterium]|nr:corrinoid protein [Clostridia bacterium]
MKVEVARALGDLDEQKVLAGVYVLKEQGISPLEIVAQLQAGMEVVGKKYENEEYFLSELIMSADIFKTAVDSLGDAFIGGNVETIRTLVIGTVSGDLHDIGKNIVTTVMSCNGFRVYDLGVDVPVEQFVDAIREHNPEFVGLSCLLTTAFDSMKKTVEEIQRAGLQDRVKILIGGGPVDESVRKYVGADYYCKNAQDAVDLCRRLLGVC